ncbi:ribonuclease H-like domain-containing protein [Tanacetum coccineum]
MAPKKRTTRLNPETTTTTPTTTSVTNAQLQAMIDQGVTAALATRDVIRSTNGEDNHNSGTGVRRNKRATRLFRFKKLEVELWDLKVKGTDVIGYNQRFQELALLCVRMFPEESDKIERYVGGLPDMIHESVVASKPNTMQETTKIVTELMDKRIWTGEKKPYGGSKPLCAKCNYHHDGSCAPKCHKCNRVGHLARDFINLHPSKLNMSASQDEIPPPPPPPPSSPQTPTQQTPHTVSTIKLPILKKGEYDIWAMKMEHYLAHTDYPIWEVIQNGNGPVSSHKITKQDQLRNVGCIKSRFVETTNQEDAKVYLEAQFEGFLYPTQKGFTKFDRFQSLLEPVRDSWKQVVSTEDANNKSYVSTSAWSQVSLIMRTKPGVDSLSFDDLYNNLRVFESDIKGSTASSSSSPQNVAFVSENTSSTNEVSTAYCVPNLSGQNTKYEQTSSYSLLANQSSCPQLDHEDLEQIDEYDLEEMDLKWQVAMISMRMKKFYKKTGRKLQFDAKEPVGFDKTKVECYNCHKTGHFARECRIKGTQDNRRRDAWNSGNKDGSRTGQKEDSKALVTIDGEGVDWTNHSEDEDYALMACNSSDSDTEVISCSNKCKESYANLKKLYDAQREQLSDASIEIKAYSQGLKKVEAQLVAHQQGQLWYEQKIKFMKIDLDDKTDVLTYHKKLLAEAQKEKEDLKAKVEKWHNSSKNLSKLLNTQMSANDKFGLGYGDHRYDAGGMHVVPPPMTGNYMPSGPDIEVDYSQFTYGPKQTQPSESESQSSEFDTCESNISTEPSELVSEPVFNESNVECQPKVWPDAPIIEEYESDSEDVETVKNQFTHSQKPKVDKTELGYGFTVRACFVCGSLNHLIRDCDFHEKRMARKAELNNRWNRKSSEREIRKTWNNVQRVNKQNQFVPSAVLTRTGKIPVNTTRASGDENANNLPIVRSLSFKLLCITETRRYTLNVYASTIQRISLTGFPAQSVGSSNTDVLDSPCLLVLITGTSQSRQHGKSESDSYYLSDLVVNSFTGPKLISSYHKLDSYRILQVTYQELV